MLIGEIVCKTGLSRDTIRFYEKQSLISIGKKERRFNNYKEYTNETLESLRMIKRIKSFGFTLNEVSVILELIETKSANCEDISEKMMEKINLIENKIRELQEIKTLMSDGIESCLTHCHPKDVRENCLMVTTDNFTAKNMNTLKGIKRF